MDYARIPVRLLNVLVVHAVNYYAIQELYLSTVFSAVNKDTNQKNFDIL